MEETVKYGKVQKIHTKNRKKYKIVRLVMKKRTQIHRKNCMKKKDEISLEHE